MVGLQYRVSIGASSEQGRLTAFTVNLAAAEAAQTFSAFTVADVGTRLTPSVGVPARSWISVRSVQMTPLVDGSGVAFGRALDFSAASGWLVQGLDNTFTPVTGKFSIDVKGLADL